MTNLPDSALPGGRRRSPSPGECGFTLVELIVVIAIIAILAALAIPSLINSRKAGNEASAVSSLRTMTTAAQVYRTRFQAYPSSLGDLSATSYIDGLLGVGVKAGYTFSYSGGTNTWSVSGTPLALGETGDRTFWVDESGVIRFEAVGVADDTSAPID